MARYFSKPRAEADCDHWTLDRLEPVPTVSDHEATDTGLLDLNGEAIMRAPNPIGFGRDEEW